MLQPLPIRRFCGFTIIRQDWKEFVEEWDTSGSGKISMKDFLHGTASPFWRMLAWKALHSCYRCARSRESSAVCAVLRNSRILRNGGG